MNIEDPRYAKALRHPLRARILGVLQEQEATPTQLAESLRASVGTVAYHVRTLHSLGLIALVGETRVRGAVAHHYRAVTGELSDDPPAGVNEHASAKAAASLQTMEPHARAAAVADYFSDAQAHATRAPLRLDAAGWEQLSQACSQLVVLADAIAESSTERLARSRGDGAREVAVIVLMFEAGAQPAAGAG